MMGNGALAGLVAITSGTSTIEPWGAIIVGLVAGALYCLGSQVSIWMKVRVVPSSLIQCHRLLPCPLDPKHAPCTPDRASSALGL